MLAGAGALAVMVASGCGSGPTPAEFTSAANAICVQANAEAVRGEEPRVALAREDRTRASLARLHPPPTLARDWAQMLALRAAQRQLVSQVIRRREGGTAPEVITATFTPRAGRLHAQLERTLARLDLTACLPARAT